MRSLVAGLLVLSAVTLHAQDLELREAEHAQTTTIDEFRAVLDLDADRLLIRPTLGDGAYDICTTEETPLEEMAEYAPEVPRVTACVALADLRRQPSPHSHWWNFAVGSGLGALAFWTFTRRD